MIKILIALFSQFPFSARNRHMSASHSLTGFKNNKNFRFNICSMSGITAQYGYGSYYRLFTQNGTGYTKSNNTRTASCSTIIAWQDMG